MAGRRTNLALLGVLALALATGTLAFAVGTAAGRWVVLAHGAAGLALLILTPGKSRIVRRARRRPVPRPGSQNALALAAVVVVAVVSGVLHALAGFRSYGGITAMQVHVTAALLAVPLVVVHLVRRWQRPRRTDLSRRTALRSAALGGGAVAAWVAVEGAAGALSLPGANRRRTGSHETGSFRPAAMPVTQWFTDAVPTVDVSSWRLRVASRELNYDELLTLPHDDVRALIDCTGGWYAVQDWRGVRLDRLLPATVSGGSIEVISVTGYRRRLPRTAATRLWLATAVGGEPLSAGHGFPVRLVAPGRRGFWWVKWVRRVELVDEPWWWQPPFPLQ